MLIDDICASSNKGHCHCVSKCSASSSRLCHLNLCRRVTRGVEVLSELGFLTVLDTYLSPTKVQDRGWLLGLLTCGGASTQHWPHPCSPEMARAFKLPEEPKVAGACDSICNARGGCS